HGLNRFLKPGRGGSNPQLAICVYYYLAASHGRPEDSRDKGRPLGPLFSDADGVGVTGVSSHVSANVDIVTASGEAATGPATQGSVIRTGAVQKREITLGCVIMADPIVVKRVDSSSDVAVACRIRIECVVSGGRIETTVRVRLKGTPTSSRVATAGGVAQERINTVGRIVVAGCVAIERLTTVGRIGGPVCVVK